MKSLLIVDLRLQSALLHKALRLLVHPLSLLALALLLVNDHLLRTLSPSTLTGKLGDFTWLFVSPLVVIAALALMLPDRHRARIVPVLSYGAVALIFAIANSLPAGHQSIVSLASRAFGFEVGWRLDPTDLIALISIVASAYLWTKTPESRVVPQLPRAAPRGGGWAALVAAALLTIANSPAPDPGIYCLEERSGEIDAYAAYATYRSTDGGLTWESLPSQSRDACPNPWANTSGASLTTSDPDDERHQYRVSPGESIEYSEDGGASWRMIYEVPRVNEATAAATRRRLSSYALVRPAPIDAKVDRATGNAVFAMGHSGVLVREAGNGAWRGVAVGTYRPSAVNGVSDFLSLLLGEILLGIAAAFLAFCTLATRLLVRGKALWIIALVVAWLIWAAVVFFFPPALTYGYGAVLTYGAMLVLGVILLVMAIIALVSSLQRAREDGRRPLGKHLVTALVAGALFLLPYALWATGALPQYVLAGVFGTLFVISVTAAGARWSRPRQDLD
jgi:hypothetical protein